MSDVVHNDTAEPAKEPLVLVNCGRADRHDAHGECVGIPLPPLPESSYEAER